ncbi:MAG: hypothetical protein NVSMB45_01740 [Ginsengibacter sp.]
MKKRGIILFTCAMILFYGCGKSSSSNGASTTPPVNESTVSISGMTFTSSSITVKVGTTVTWTNTDNMQHTVTADDGSWTSGNLNYGDKFAYTFAYAGTANYHCKYHPGMKGSVTVQ